MKYLFALLAMFGAVPAFAVDTYTLDKEHTNVIFMVNHLGFSDMVGRFEDVSGSFTFDPASPAMGTADIRLNPAAIRTSSAKLDEHLRGPDFFNTAKFPDIRFVSVSVKPKGPSDAELTGNLTLLGVTKPVVLAVHFNKADYQPITGIWVAGFNATAKIKRSDFGMTKYVPMVGDEVSIIISTEGMNTAKIKPAGEDKR